MGDGRPRLVAIVDDDASVRESMTFLLETADYSVRGYDSAGRFLDEADWRELDCLVVDQHMPNLTGLEVLARLRGQGARLPVVLITGSTSPELERRAAELEATVLAKPLLAEDLLGVLGRVME
jgi:two-component system response regulator FixJ